MSQRDSGYERKERDCYETPEWVTLVLARHLCLDIEFPIKIWEPACGSGKMERVLRDLGHEVRASDITGGNNFLMEKVNWGMQAIITNPPYDLATEFIQHAIELMRPSGFVAMLLRTDFDHAKTRQYLFGQCPKFKTKLVLTKRIKWFEDSKGQPSFNHAWFIWDCMKIDGLLPNLVYGP